MNQDSKDYPASAYTAMVVGILMIFTFFSLIDRMIPAFLVDPIRQSLSISDTEFSLIQGSAFAIIFSLAGLPFGWLVDRSNRRKIIAGGAAVWSAATVFCGLADSFWQLFVGRVFVGIGEAALAPAVYSLIADYVPPHKRGRTITTYFLSSSIGSGVAFIIIGILITAGPPLFAWLGFDHQFEPWQIAFILAGVPGLLLLPALATIREVPRRSNSGQIKTVTSEEISMSAFCCFLKSNKRVFFCIYFSIACLMFVNVAGYSWIPTLLMREFNLNPAAIRTPLGLTIATAGFLGTVVSIFWTSRAGRTGRSGDLVLLLVGSMGILVVTEFIWPLASTWQMMLLLFGIRTFAIGATYSAAPAIIQEIVPNAMRGKAVAIYMIMIGFAGYAAGPTVVALFTDYVFGDDLALKYSLFVSLAPASVLGLLSVIACLKSYDRLRISLSQG